jgi:arylsulfatase A-like enzyme
MDNKVLLGIGAVSIVSFTSIAPSCTEMKQEYPLKPNIIIFMVDDMGWQDTSVPFWKEKTHFNKLYHTPYMELLAENGMKFVQAYASSVCSPTRTSLMTGMNVARHRVTNWTLFPDLSQDVHCDILEFPVWNMNGLQPVDTIRNSIYATTLTQILQDNGYFTIHTGKAHWGAVNTPGSEPLNLGFDINIAGDACGGLSSFQGYNNFGNPKGGYDKPWGVPGLEKYHGDTINLTHALTIEAISALDSARAAGKPFYLYMSHYTLHYPIEPDYEFYDNYKDLDIHEIEAKYASMVEGMDRSLGDLMKHLDENDLTENTIIIFMSDNGGLSAWGRGGEQHTHNQPLSSGKGSAHEGGIRVPMIVKWPGVTPKGSVCQDYLIIEDFFPSILEMAGITDYLTVQEVDGQSFIPMLKQTGSTAIDRNLFWHYPNNWGPVGPGIGPSSTVLNGDWKFIYYYRDQSMELFCLNNDISEKNNLILSETEKAKELAGLLGVYLRSVDAQRPTFKASGEIVQWPDEIFFW